MLTWVVGDDEILQRLFAFLQICLLLVEVIQLSDQLLSVDVLFKQKNDIVLSANKIVSGLVE
jgi:hypothetical protein